VQMFWAWSQGVESTCYSAGLEGSRERNELRRARMKLGEPGSREDTCCLAEDDHLEDCRRTARARKCWIPGHGCVQMENVGNKNSC